MTKEIRCDDLVPGCTFVAQAENEDELMQAVAEHARTVHGISPVPPEVADKARTAIRTV
jgi:predicted small metal-binding protein